MSNIGKKERETQDRVIALMDKELGYHYLGNWEDRAGNSNVEEELLNTWLVVKKGVEKDLAAKAIFEFNKVVNDQGKSLYDINKEVYSMLRYGVPVRPDIGMTKASVFLIDWKYPLENDVAVAEDVTITSKHDKRPDTVV